MRGTPLALALFATGTAMAAEPNVVKKPDEHLVYLVEIEPHATFAYGAGPGPWRLAEVDTYGVGGGARVHFCILQDGFLSNLNNSVAIGTGMDVLYLPDPQYQNVRLLLPFDLQWTFYLSPYWSVFGELGFSIAFAGTDAAKVMFPSLEVGGRFHFSERVALTVRLGFPVLNVGISIFL